MTLLVQVAVPIARVLADDSITNSYCIQLPCAYYDPNSTGAACDNTATPITTESTQLSSDIVNAINKLKPDYEKAATATGVPWQLLAAVHYEEANNNPDEDLQAGNPIGGSGSQYASYPYGIPTSLEQSAEFAGKQLANLATSTGVVKKPINIPNPDPEAIKDTLFSYNGRADAYAQQAAKLGFDPVKQPYEGSPYVMNNYDDKHRNMLIITQDFGQPDTVDTRFGAFAVYAFLGGSTAGGGNCSSSGAVAGSAVQTAINYAWPDYHDPPYFEMKQSYTDAIAKAQENGEYVGGGAHPGIDCGGFVTRVMRDSGADPNYNWGPHDSRQGNTLAQQAYMDAHPEKYQKLGPQTGTNNLQPGDIAINSVHTFIYVGSQPGFHGSSASASFSTTGESWRSPMASGTDTPANYTWYRLIKAGQ